MKQLYLANEYGEYNTSQNNQLTPNVRHDNRNIQFQLGKNNNKSSASKCFKKFIQKYFNI